KAEDIYCSRTGGPATLAADNETITCDLNLDGTSDFTRILDRSQNTLARSAGFQLKNGSTLENQTTHSYHASDARECILTFPDRGHPSGYSCSSSFHCGFCPRPAGCGDAP
ncbi:MAG: hypothetical protein Q8Q59_01010, partial [Luteolibacter sp.]|nr:hypothetical protein [Luteolibacter sp.]